MNRLSTFAFCTILVIVIITSCKKESNPSIIYVAPPPPPTVNLSGKEFIFDSLQWRLYHGTVDEIYIITDSRPELFSTDLPIDTYLKLDTASGWMQLSRVTNPMPSSTSFYYDIVRSYAAFLYVEKNYPLNYSLVGTKAAIKVKFL